MAGVPANTNVKKWNSVVLCPLLPLTQALIWPFFLNSMSVQMICRQALVLYKRAQIFWSGVIDLAALKILAPALGRVLVSERLDSVCAVKKIQNLFCFMSLVLLASLKEKQWFSNQRTLGTQTDQCQVVVVAVWVLSLTWLCVLDHGSAYHTAANNQCVMVVGSSCCCRGRGCSCGCCCCGCSCHSDLVQYETQTHFILVT